MQFLFVTFELLIKLKNLKGRVGECLNNKIEGMLIVTIF